MATNDAIKALVGTSNGEQSSTSGAVASSPTLTHISTNGNLLNQNISELIKAIRALKTSWLT